MGNDSALCREVARVCAICAWMVLRASGRLSAGVHGAMTFAVYVGLYVR